jgi:hypothetical protein
VKAPEVAPLATTTDDGTVNAALLLERLTVAPLEPAACDSVTVHAEAPPDVNEAGEHCRLVTVVEGAEGVTVTDAVAEPPFKVAVTVAV